MSRMSRTRMSLLVSRNGLPYSPIADLTDISSHMTIICTPVQCAIDSSFKVNNDTCHLWSAEHSVRPPAPPSSFTTALSCHVSKHMARLLDREVPHQKSCLHVRMQVRQSHHITEVNWYPSYIVVMVISEKPVYTLRREVAIPDRSYTPLQDNEP